MCRFARSQRTRLDTGAVISEIGERQRLRDKSWLDSQKMCESIDPCVETIFVPSFCTAYVMRLYCLCWRYSIVHAKGKSPCIRTKEYVLGFVDFKLDNPGSER
jgi:hypothetical protein